MQCQCFFNLAIILRLLSFVFSLTKQNDIIVILKWIFSPYRSCFMFTAFFCIYTLISSGFFFRRFVSFAFIVMCSFVTLHKASSSSAHTHTHTNTLTMKILVVAICMFCFPSIHLLPALFASDAFCRFTCFSRSKFCCFSCCCFCTSISISIACILCAGTGKSFELLQFAFGVVCFDASILVFNKPKRK